MITTESKKCALLVQYCEQTYGTEFCPILGAVNIVYLEGANPDLSPNEDRPDKWNDVRAVIQFDENGKPRFTHIAQATTEPGTSATRAKKSQKLGGVARIAIGFHKDKWQVSYHKRNPSHPALVQAAPINVYRDFNMDGKRTNDIITADVQGLNQHGTRRNVEPVVVGEWSYGCLVGRNWTQHLLFMDTLVKRDPRYLLKPSALFSSTVVDYSKFTKWAEQQN